MSEQKHTPGPWVRHDTADYAEIHPASGRQHSAIALVGRAEDADLIAAAPDLLEMAKWAESAIAPFSKEPAEQSGITRLRAAIAKAEGRS